MATMLIFPIIQTETVKLLSHKQMYYFPSFELFQCISWINKTKWKNRELCLILFLNEVKR